MYHVLGLLHIGHCDVRRNLQGHCICDCTVYSLLLGVFCCLGFIYFLTMRGYIWSLTERMDG